MTLHSQISKPELIAFCELCHEHKIKSVKVDTDTAKRISKIALGISRFMGVRFKIRQFPALAAR